MESDPDLEYSPFKTNPRTWAQRVEGLHADFEKWREASYVGEIVVDYGVVREAVIRRYAIEYAVRTTALLCRHEGKLKIWLRIVSTSSLFSSGLNYYSVDVPAALLGDFADESKENRPKVVRLVNALAEKLGI